MGTDFEQDWTERRVLAGLKGPHGEVIRIIGLQPLRATAYAHLLGPAIPVPR